MNENEWMKINMKMNEWMNEKNLIKESQWINENKSIKMRIDCPEKI